MSCSCNKPKACGDADFVELTLIRFIKSLCGCGSEKPVEPGGCNASFLPIRPGMDIYPDYFTVSKNGGEFVTINIYEFVETESGYNYITEFMMDDTLKYFAFFKYPEMYGHWPEEQIEVNELALDFCGLTETGLVKTLNHPEGFAIQNPIAIEGVDYFPEFKVIPGINTLSFKATPDVDRELDFFTYMDNPNNDEIITISSCAMLDLGVGQEVAT